MKRSGPEERDIRVRGRTTWASFFSASDAYPKYFPFVPSWKEVCISPCILSLSIGMYPSSYSYKRV